MTISWKFTSLVQQEDTIEDRDWIWLLSLLYIFWRVEFVNYYFTVLRSKRILKFKPIYRKLKNYKGWNLEEKNDWKHLLLVSVTSILFVSVIEPVSAETRVIISKDNNSSMPKVFSDVSLAEIDVLLSRQQVNMFFFQHFQFFSICLWKNTLVLLPFNYWYILVMVIDKVNHSCHGNR